MPVDAVTSLLDVPRCLNAEAIQVGPPRVAPTLKGRGRSRPDAAGDGIRTLRARAAIECFDTAAVLRSYREPAAAEDWQTPRASEERLLAQIEALVALGRDALGAVAQRAIDPDLTDPGRVFAALLTLGSVDGDRWMPAIGEIFVAAAERGAGEASAAAEALALAPNPLLVQRLAALARHDRTRVRAASVRALAFRGTLAEAAWHEALHDADEQVVQAALRAPLTGFDASACEAALAPHLADSSERVVRAALQAGASRRLHTAHAVARAIANGGDPDWAGAAACLASFGLDEDTPIVASLLESSPSRHVLQAAATCGRPALVAPLLDLLDRGVPTLATSVRQVLETITGLPFTAAAAGAADPRTLWASHRSGFDSRQRYRGGHPLDVAGLLRALAGPGGSRERRQAAAAELRVATGSAAPRFHAHEFVAAQIASLHRIAAWLRAAPQRRHPLTALV